MTPIIELGMTAKDTVTGFTGIVIAKYEYLYGCSHYFIQPKINDKRKIVEGQTLDEYQIEIIDTEKKCLPVYIMEVPIVELGVTAVDNLTGLVGVVMARYLFISGSVRYALQPEMEEGEEEYPKSFTCDGPHVEVIVNEDFKRSRNLCYHNGKYLSYICIFK